MPFRPTHLRYFVTVAEEGQVTSAARRLQIAQPALSQAISQLERELGLQLLERHARGVKLTPEGEAFLAKARVAVESELEAEREAQALASTAHDVVKVGFVGPPPTITARKLFSAFATAHPNAEIAFRDLPFPRGTTRSWLEPVDVAFCHQPDLDASILAQVVRTEPRVVIARRSHPLSQSSEVDVESVLDQTFIGYHPNVQAAWSSFHSLDDHRGGPPESMTTDWAETSMQMLGVMSSCEAITTLPACDGKLVEHAISDAVAIPLSGASPALLSLICPADDCPPLVGALVRIAAELSSDPAADGAIAARSG
jgi:DNA-binding transcriptional LysR family regulator